MARSTTPENHLRTLLRAGEVAMRQGKIEEAAQVQVLVNELRADLARQAQ
jgi:hypothetical protein